MYAAYVRAPKLCKGEEKNVKLTYAEDFRKAFSRVGIGVDTHAFGKKQDFILLGGVKIPAQSGLVAHSDGDVLAHAVCDALLSAAGLNDIGHYFPDTDEKWKNADSMQMLAPYIHETKTSLAAALSLPVSAVGVSAGTNEKLGYVGEGKGITVNAAVLLETL